MAEVYRHELKLITTITVNVVDGTRRGMSRAALHIRLDPGVNPSAMGIFSIVFLLATAELWVSMMTNNKDWPLRMLFLILVCLGIIFGVSQ